MRDTDVEMPAKTHFPTISNHAASRYLTRILRVPAHCVTPLLIAEAKAEITADLTGPRVRLRQRSVSACVEMHSPVARYVMTPDRQTIVTTLPNRRPLPGAKHRAGVPEEIDGRDKRAKPVPRRQKTQGWREVFRRAEAEEYV